LAVAWHGVQRIHPPAVLKVMFVDIGLHLVKGIKRRRVKQFPKDLKDHAPAAGAKRGQ